MSDKKKCKLLLIMPTFWDIIAPSVGIVSLKSFLEKFGHQVTVVNLNEEQELWNTQGKYLEVLKSVVPEKSILPRLGSELLGFHSQAKVFKDDYPEGYINYIEILLKDHFQYLLRDVSKVKIALTIEKLEAVLDKHFSNVKKIVPELLSVNPDFVGCSMLSSTLGTALFLLREIKNKFPEVTTVLGGPGPYNGISSDSENLKKLADKCSFVDKIIFGEGELVLKEIIEKPHSGGKIISALNFNIGQLKMDSLPFLDYSDLNLKKYFNLGIGVSRGCPYKCSFCSETMVWGNFRTMSVERIIKEIEAHEEKYGKKGYFFTDALMNHSLNGLAKKLLSKKIKIEMDCYMRVDKHTQMQEFTDLWAKAGLSRIRLGMESGSAQILKAMNKKVTPGAQMNSLECLRKSGIKTTTYWIVGFPGETEEHFQETLSLIKKMKNNIYELDLAIFYFYGEGEIGRDEFVDNNGGLQDRFPPEFEPLSIFRYYKLKDLQPSREEAMDRAIRFINLAKENGIPCNRSSVIDLLEAEKRWKRLAKL
ncbi:MAG: hypothetical protein CMD96_06870 [Gammaproteobacteria bacterium]|nr:hypothetical protein [Gammaproteobacteria bacterium]HJP17162.1 radical SAM protein [Nitrospinota bacterium]|tara:strand:+ start:2162 stop:3763 length:1602 start_codon:yes stop_codon:yes gene_type:complete